MKKVFSKKLITVISMLTIFVCCCQYSAEAADLSYSSSGKRHFTVVLDAGHGGFDSGALGRMGSEEKNNTLAVTLKLGKLLESKGFRVIYTRTSDNITWPVNERLNLQARVNISNYSGADLFICIHNNSSSITSVNGVETYFYRQSTRSKNLAKNIENEIAQDVKVRNRGIRTANYYVLKHTNCPAVLIELGYITNINDESKLRSSDYQYQYASAISNGISAYLKNK